MNKRLSMKILAAMAACALGLCLCACSGHASTNNVNTNNAANANVSATTANATNTNANNTNTANTNTASTASNAANASSNSSSSTQATSHLTFRSYSLMKSHYEKHGIDMGFSSMEDYLAAANAVVANPDCLHKTEAEDGDDIYYLEVTNEIVFVSTDGYIRTYFCPDSGKKYYDKQ